MRQFSVKKKKRGKDQNILEMRVSFTKEKTINGFRVRQMISNSFKCNSECVKARNLRGNRHHNSAK